MLDGTLNTLVWITDVRLALQTLERPFTDADGARLMSALRFDADNTIADRPMVELLAQIQHMLAGARARAGSGTLP